MKIRERAQNRGRAARHAFERGDRNAYAAHMAWLARFDPDGPICYVFWRAYEMESPS